jgi:glucose/arabinose dehydrogenase
MRPSRGLLLVLALATALAACDDDEPEARDPADAPTVEAPDAFTPDEPDREAPEPPDRPDLAVEVALTPVLELDAPTAGAAGPDGALYLAARGGTVHRLDDDADTEVLDLGDETTTDGERGLLGLAFAADGSELYVSFTDLEGDTVVDAVAVEDGELVPDERRTVFTLPQPYRNHNGGDVRVGPEGLLYLGLGDGGGAGDPVGAGQDLSTPLGALLRIDPQAAEPYGIPDDNPFVDDEEAAGEIFAYGLRNPWRFSFDRRTGDLWIADVGQDEREEVNVVGLDEAAGANFGWNLMEGTLEYDGEEPDDHVPPVYEYETRGPEGCAITGGHVYRGEAIPELVGAYLYSDYCEGSIRALVVEDGEVVEQGDLGVATDATVAFVEDADGETYVLDLEGTVFRLEPAA